MKNFIITTLFILLPLGLCAQSPVQFFEDFSDANFTERWQGDVGNFTVNATEQLQSNTGQLATSANYYISRNIALTGVCEWRFFVNLKFGTSTTNNIDFYLMSDKQNLTANNINGYFVRVGNGAASTSGRQIVLYKVENGTATPIITSESNLVNSTTNNPFFIKIARSEENIWTLQYNKTGWGDAFTTIATPTFNADIENSAYTGIFVRQSAIAAPANNHFFDDIYVFGEEYKDKIPPTVTEIAITNDNQLTVSFSEPINPVDENNFSLSGVGLLSKPILSADGQTVTLTFAETFVETFYTLTMHTITDLAGNSLQITDYKVVIPEKIYLLKDDFSDGEFTENPTWSGNEDSFEVIDVEGNYMLHSINQTANAKFYLSTPSSVATNCQWEFWTNLQFNTSNPNTVDVFLMSDKQNLWDTGITGYFVKIGTSDDKISLFKRINGTDTEIVVGDKDVTNASNNILKIRVTRDEDNVWTLEYDKTGTGNLYNFGGSVTDGEISTNSYFGIAIAQSTSGFFGKHYFDNIYAGPIVETNITAPSFISATILFTAEGEIIRNNQLLVQFSKRVNFSSAAFFVSEGMGVPNKVQPQPNNSSVLLTFSSDFQPQTVYTLIADNVIDANGLSLINNEFKFGLPELPEQNDLVINEVMFNNPDAAEEYVEIYNKSNKILDVSGVRITTLKTTVKEGQSPYNTGATIPQETIILPGGYLALCKTPDIEREYFNAPDTARFAVVAIPSLNNESATLVLCTSAYDIIFDQLTYSSKWHYPLIKNVKGVALERIDPFAETQKADNWLSASALVNYGTPGYKNSQYRVPEKNASEKMFWFENKVFTPDNDGIDDILILHYKMPEGGYSAIITVYDASGQKIRTVCSGEELGIEGTVTWNGSTDRNKAASIGIYAMYIELYNAKTGKKIREKLACVVSTR